MINEIKKEPVDAFSFTEQSIKRYNKERKDYAQKEAECLALYEDEENEE